MLLYACYIKYRIQETCHMVKNNFFSVNCVVSSCNDGRGRDFSKCSDYGYLRLIRIFDVVPSFVK